MEAFLTLVILINALLPKTTVVYYEPPTFAQNIIESISEKDEKDLKWRMGYNEGKDGWLYNVEFSDIEIIAQVPEIYGFSEVIKFTVSESSDPRFPVGDSYRILKNHGSDFVESFLDINDTGEYHQGIFDVNSITDRDRAAILAYCFDYSFEFFSDIPDIGDYITNMYKDENRYGNKTFESVPVYIGFSSENRLSQEYVNTWYYNLLGVTEQPYDLIEYTYIDEHEGYYLPINEQNYKYWEAHINWRLDEATDNTITITYFADTCFLTPAKTMKYTYEVHNNIPRLLSSEVIEDFGYEPYIFSYI
jgi:hypothetical protein